MFIFSPLVIYFKWSCFQKEYSGKFDTTTFFDFFKLKYDVYSLVTLIFLPIMIAMDRWRHDEIDL